MSRNNIKLILNEDIVLILILSNYNMEMKFSKSIVNEAKIFKPLCMKFIAASFLLLMVLSTFVCKSYYGFFLFKKIISISPNFPINCLTYVYTLFSLITISFTLLYSFCNKIGYGKWDIPALIVALILFFNLCSYILYIINPENLFLIMASSFKNKNLSKMINNYVFYYVFLPTLFNFISGLVIIIKYYTEVLKNPDFRKKTIPKVMDPYRFVILILLTIILFLYLLIFAKYLYDVGLTQTFGRILTKILIIVCYISIPVVVLDLLTFIISLLASAV